MIVLDVRMPDLDGRWLCSEARRLAPQAQILPLTADAAGGALMRRFGALRPLLKPVGVAAVAAALSHALTLPPPTTVDHELAAFFDEQVPANLKCTRCSSTVFRTFDTPTARDEATSSAPTAAATAAVSAAATSARLSPSSRSVRVRFSASGETADEGRKDDIAFLREHVS